MIDYEAAILSIAASYITCNHFNPYDSFAIEKVFRESGQSKDKKLYKVIE